MCRPAGGTYGSPIISDANGKVTGLEFYLEASIQSTTPSITLLWNQAKLLFTSLKYLLLINSDSSSFCQFSLDSSLSQAKVDWFKILPTGVDDVTGNPIVV